MLPTFEDLCRRTGEPKPTTEYERGRRDGKVQSAFFLAVMQDHLMRRQCGDPGTIDALGLCAAAVLTIPSERTG